MNVGEPDIVNPPASVIVPAGAVNVPPVICKASVDDDPLRSAPSGSERLPELNVTFPAITNVVYVLKSAVAPATVKPFVVILNPLNPDNTAPAFIVNELFPVRVPDPDSVPFVKEIAPP